MPHDSPLPIRWLAPIVVLQLLIIAPAAAQDTGGEVHGRVLAEETDQPLAGVRVYVPGTTRGTLTSEEGTFRIEDVPPGERVVLFEFIGRRTERRTVDFGVGSAVRLEVRLEEQALAIDELVISTTREAQSLARTAASVGVVQSSEIREERPTHPSEIMDRVPGVWVNVTGGEGHMTAIRQPLSTDPVYLYLEDGVPTRSTGFFNHNALYEVNVPQADRIEVIKGPSTALYGSDAIGGTINVETRAAVADPGLDLTFEGGEHGFVRALGSYAFTGDRDGVRADVNLTRTDGWRAGTGYDRQSATVRWDRSSGDAANLKAIASFSRIDQQTAGSSRLPRELYLDQPTRNPTPISFRRVHGARLSLEYERVEGPGLLSVTPFARYNAMDILPNWSLTYDPAVWEIANHSLGFLARYRRDAMSMDARVIVGLDVDWSPGEHFERRIDPVREEDTFTAYSEGEPIYDYDVTFLGFSPYLHAEASPFERLRITGGLRFDRLAYDYQNHLGPLPAGQHRRPSSTEVSFRELSPKIGASVDLGWGASAYASYSQGFRVPSEGQLFRQGPSTGTVGLEPVEAVNREVGLRGALGRRLSYEVSGYWMAKRNDILEFQRADETRVTQNAGETLHRGLEFGLGMELPFGILVETALSRARHTYEDWQPAPSIDFGGNEMESAPRTVGNIALSWRSPDVEGLRIAFDWSHLGEYWLNPQNSEKYSGHDVFTARANIALAESVELFARVNNLLDERYAESAGWSAVRGPEFAPGLPRTFYLGLQTTPGGS